MAKILFIQPYDFSNFLGQKKRKRFFISRSQFEVGYQIPKKHDYFVLDLNLAIRQKRSVLNAIRDAVQHQKPDLIFLTYPSFPQGGQISLILHCLARVTSVPIVMGGGAIFLIEGAPMRFWPKMNIACCYSGFGNQLPAIIESVITGVTNEIPGVSWRKKGVAETKKATECIIDAYESEDLYSARGRIDFPEYLENIKKYGFNPYAIVELERGCLHRCSFCAINKKNFGFFHRSPAVVANEIEYLANEGIVAFRVADPTFGLVAEKTNELLELMVLAKEKFPNISFEITTRADVISRKKAELFKRAGIVRCDIGMETMSEVELASVRKDVKRERLIKAVREISVAGIETKLFHITFPQKISVPTIDFLLGLSREQIPFLVQSAYLRGIPTPQSEPYYSNQDQKIFCEKSDSIEQIMEWMLINLAFKSTNTQLHEPMLREKIQDVLDRSADLKTLFEATQLGNQSVLMLKPEFNGRRYYFQNTKKTPFMWCLKEES